MIMEDFVTYELSVKLKEKGFNYPCVGHYVNNQLYIAHYYNAYHSDKDESPDAPTISQVLKWLREKEISIEPCATSYNYWYYMIKENGTIKVTYTGEDYNNYEQAAIAGVNYCLDNLI